MTRGIRTLEDLKDRCFVDEDTGCWIYRGGALKSGEKIWIPQLQQVVGLGVAICFLKTGKLPKTGVVWHSLCMVPWCANPEHRKAGTRSTQMLAAGLVRSPMQRMKMSKNRRDLSLLTEAQAQEIRESSETVVALAAKYGVSRGTVSNIRRLMQRRPVAVGSSVFSMGAIT